MTFSKLSGIFCVGFMLIIFAVPGAAETDDFNADIRFLHVQPGQTLHNIVRRLYPKRRKDWSKIKQTIIKLNSHAFVDGKESRMRAGVRLELPHRSVIKPASVLKLKYVGDVLLTRGRVVAVGKNQLTRKLIAGDKVFIGDKLITGEDGFLRLKMIDSARLDLRCYSIMVIEDYAIKSANRRSIIKLLQGSLRKVTGEIGKFKDDVYELSTPVASVGVRGTEYALRVFQTRGCDGTIDIKDEGLFLTVIKGLVDVKNHAGRVVVASGDQVYVPLPDKPPVKKVIEPGIIEPVKEPPKPAPEPEESNFWWWILGIALIAAAI